MQEVQKQSSWQIRIVLFLFLNEIESRAEFPFEVMLVKKLHTKRPILVSEVEPSMSNTLCRIQDFGKGGADCVWF